MNQDETVKRVRGAIADRARYLACLYRSFARALPPEEAESRSREAIREYGRIRAARDGESMSPEKWVETHLAQMGDIFESQIEKHDDYSEMRMYYCPLLEEWKQMGCSPEEQDLLCDIAMELDRSRAASHGLQCRIPKRLGKGDAYCSVLLSRKA